MKLTKQIAPNTDGLKEKNFNNIPEFFKWAVQENGGNYETIFEQLRIASATMRRMARGGEYFDLSVEYKFLTNEEFSKFYHLQPTANKFTIKGVNNFISTDEKMCEIAVQKSIDNASIAVTITQDNNETSKDPVLHKQSHECSHSLTTLHFSDHHLAMEYQGDTHLDDIDGCDHCHHKTGSAAFTFDHKTNLVNDFSCTRSDNNDMSWSREQTKRLPKRKEQDEICMTK